MKYKDLETASKKWKGQVCLFGMGLIGNTWGLDIISLAGFHVNFYCDNHLKERKELNGIKVISPAELYLLGNSVLVFITVSYKNQSIIRNQLAEQGIENIVAVDNLFLQSFIESVVDTDDIETKQKYGIVVDDELFLGRQFEYRLGHKLNLKEPKTFNEKIQWLKVHSRNPDYIRMVDKYEVKQYIKEKIADINVIPTIGIWNSVEEIEIESLPDKFVIKCTHDSGSTIICKDKLKFNWQAAKMILDKSIKFNYYWASREWPYKKVVPRIIAENYIENNTVEQKELVDYKFICFNGQAKIVFVCTQRFTGKKIHVTFFDREWNELPFERHYPKEQIPLKCHNKYSEMLQIAEKLSIGPLVRIDFIVSDQDFYFGEITFYPGGGMEEFTPDKYDELLGEWITLSCCNN